MQSYQRFQHVDHTAFNTSGTNGPRSLFRMKAGTHSPSPAGAHTAAHTPKRGVFQMGALSLPSSRFARFGNSARPGVRTANFAAFGPWSGALPKNAESLRNSDALMRVAVPRRRGPAGLRDLFLLLSELWLTHHVFSAFRMCETRGGITTLGVLCVLPKLPAPAC